MPLIKPRTRGKHMLRYIARLDRETLETLHAYAAFLGEPPDYVLTQVIDTVLAKDKEFVRWRAQHPQSFMPKPAAPTHNTSGGSATGSRFTTATTRTSVGPAPSVS